MAELFVSYSRMDQDFTAILVTALQHAQRDVWIDQSGILPASNWRQEISDAIDAATAVLFIISPDSLASPECQKELTYAIANKKRIIPILWREGDTRLLPPEVATLNWIDMRDPRQLDEAFKKILFALDTDLAYWHSASDLLVRARQWEDHHRQPAFTLRGEALVAAERWLAEGSTKQPSPTMLQTQFITASRRATLSRQQLTIGMLSAGLVITLVLVVIASLLNVRLTQSNHLLGAEALAGQSATYLHTNDIDRAALLANLAYAQSQNALTRSTLEQAMEYSPNLETTLQSNVNGQLDSNAYVEDVAYSQKGALLMAVSYDHTTLWDATSHTIRLVIPTRNAYVGAINAAGTLVVTLGKYAQAQIWDATTGKQRGALDGTLYDTAGINGATPQIQFSPDGKTIAAVDCSDANCQNPGRIILWNAATGHIIKQIPLVLPPQFTSLSFGPTGQYLAFTEEADGQSRFGVWDITKARMLFAHLAPETDIYDTVALRSDGLTLAIGGEDITDNIGIVTLWSLKKDAAEQTIVHENDGAVTRMAFSDDGQWLVETNIKHTLRLWNVPLGSPAGPALTGHTAEIRALAFSPDGMHFVSAADDNRLLLWRVATYTAKSFYPDIIAQNRSQIAQSPDGTELAAVDSTLQTATIWDEASETPKNIGLTANLAPSDFLNSLAFDHHGIYFAAGTQQGHIIIWDRSQGQQIADVIASPTNDVITKVSFSPDDSLILASSYLGKSVTVINAATFKATMLLPGKGLLATAATFSPDGAQIVVGTFDASRNDAHLALWDAHAQSFTASLPQTYSRFEDIQFSHDGKHFVTITNDALLTLWDAKTHQPTASFSTSRNITFYPSLTFTPDDKLLIVSHNTTIETWQIDGATSTLYDAPFLNDNQVYNTVVSADGRYVIASQEYGPILFRSLRPADWQQAACAIANRNLSQTEWKNIVQPLLPNLSYHTLCPGVAAHE